MSFTQNFGNTLYMHVMKLASVKHISSSLSDIGNLKLDPVLELTSIKAHILHFGAGILYTNIVLSILY